MKYILTRQLLDSKNAAKFLGLNIAEFRKLVTNNDEVELLKNGKKRPDISDDPILLALAKPMKEKFDFDEIVKEQGYKGPDRARFAKIVRELDIREPIEELLATLTK